MTSRTANRVTAELEREMPELRLDKELSLTLGRMSMALARAVLRLSDEDVDDEELRFLRGVRRVEVGIYRIVEADFENSDPRLLGLGERMSKKGWYNIVRTSDDDENTWVYSKPNADADLRGLIVIALAGDELVVVRLDGYLQDALAQAAIGDPQGLAKVFASEADTS
jgi:hypothetical protein